MSLRADIGRYYFAERRVEFRVPTTVDATGWRYGQCDAANALKRFLIGQFVKFFLLIGPLNASKHLQQDFDHSRNEIKITKVNKFTRIFII